MCRSNTACPTDTLTQIPEVILFGFSKKQLLIVAVLVIVAIKLAKAGKIPALPLIG